MNSTAFADALELNDWDLARQLVNNGFDVNEEDEYGQYPLEVVLQDYDFRNENDPQLTLVLLLIENNAKLKTKDMVVQFLFAGFPINIIEKIFNKTKFKIPTDILSKVVEFGANSTYLRYVMELIKFLERNNFKFTEKNLGLVIPNSLSDYQIGERTEEYRLEALSDILPIYDYLLAKGADVNFKASQGHTALMRASMNNFPELCEYLIKKGAIIDTQSDKGFTALMFASGEIYKMCVWEYTETSLMIVKLLLDNGANNTLQSNNKRTAFSFAKSSKNMLAMELLQ